MDFTDEAKKKFVTAFEEWWKNENEGMPRLSFAATNYDGIPTYWDRDTNQAWRGYYAALQFWYEG